MLGAEVQVWRVDLVSDPDVTANAWRVLNARERAAADELKDSLDRARKVQTRAVLREILGRTLDRAPASLALDESPDGKPELRKSDSADLHFNVSHSGSRALIATSESRPVGVDVELIRDFEWRAVAHSFFAPEELAGLDATDPEHRLNAFFDCWVRKEAYVKAIGTGLRRSTSDFHVPLDGGGGLVDDPSGTDDRSWYVRALDLGPGWSAAVAVPERDVRVILHAWSDQPG